MQKEASETPAAEPPKAFFLLWHQSWEEALCPQEGGEEERWSISVSHAPTRLKTPARAQSTLVYSQTGRMEKQKQGQACFSPAFPAWESVRFLREIPLPLSVPLKFLAISWQWAPNPKGSQ